MLLHLGWMFWLAVAFLLVALLPGVFSFLFVLIIGPFKVGATARANARMAVTPVAESELAPEVADSLALMKTQFEGQGFEQVGILQNEGTVRGVTAVIAVFVNRQSGDIGRVIHVNAKLNRSMTMGVTSDFADGSTVITATSNQTGFLPTNPAIDAMVFANAKDVPSLVEAHRRRLAKLAKSGRARHPLPVENAAMELSRRDNERSFQWFVESGYYYLDNKQSAYRLTWKGACLAAWKLEPHIRRWRTRRRDAKAALMWKELGMDQRELPVAQLGSTPPPPPVPSAPAVGQLGYIGMLPRGEIRYVREARHVRVLVGGQTRRQYLMGQWPKLLALSVAIVPFVLLLYVALVQWRMYGFARPAFVSTLWSLAGLLGVVALSDVIVVMRGVRTANGTATLLISPDEILYENAPTSPPGGRIARDDIGLLAVVYHAGLLLGRYYGLKIRSRENARLVTLAVSRDREALTRLRNELAWAMGIERRPAP